MTELTAIKPLSFLDNYVRVRHQSESEFTISFLATGPLGAYVFRFTESGQKLVSCLRTTSTGPRLPIKGTEAELWQRFESQIELLKRDFGQRTVNKELPSWIRNLKAMN